MYRLIVSSASICTNKPPTPLHSLLAHKLFYIKWTVCSTSIIWWSLHISIHGLTQAMGKALFVMHLLRIWALLN